MHLEGTTSTQETQIETRDLMCPICMSKNNNIYLKIIFIINTKIGIAEDPHITSCCHRIFCEKDANSSRYENGCPLCRELNYSFEQSAKHKSMLDQLTIKCTCSERIAPHEYENHLERCSNVTFICPHAACREKVNKLLLK
jgi:hypothetical protein